MGSTVNINDSYIATSEQIDNVNNPFYHIKEDALFNFIYNENFDDTTSQYCQAILAQIYNAVNACNNSDVETLKGTIDSLLTPYQDAQKELDALLGEKNNCENAIKNLAEYLENYTSNKGNFDQTLQQLTESISEFINVSGGSSALFGENFISNLNSLLSKIKETNFDNFAEKVDSLKVHVKAIVSELDEIQKLNESLKSKDSAIYINTLFNLARGNNVSGLCPEGDNGGDLLSSAPEIIKYLLDSSTIGSIINANIGISQSDLVAKLTDEEVVSLFSNDELFNAALKAGKFDVSGTDAGIPKADLLARLNDTDKLDLVPHLIDKLYDKGVAEGKIDNSKLTEGTTKADLVNALDDNDKKFLLNKLGQDDLFSAALKANKFDVSGKDAGISKSDLLAKLSGAEKRSLYNVDKIYNAAISAGKFSSCSKKDEIKTLFLDKLSATESDSVRTIKQGLVDKLAGVNASYASGRMANYVDLFVSQEMTIKSIEAMLYGCTDSPDRPLPGNNSVEADTSDGNSTSVDMKGLIKLYGDYGESVEQMKKIASNSDYNYAWSDTKSVEENNKDLVEQITQRLASKEGDIAKAEAEVAERKKDYDAAYNEYASVLKGNANDLLNLALTYNPPNGQGVRLASVTKKIAEDGTVTYIANKEETNSSSRIGAPAEASNNPFVSSEEALSHLNIVYYALAICYQKSLGVKDLVADQVEKIEEQNRLIKVNNDYLKYANKLYEEIYKKAALNKRDVFKYENVTVDGITIGKFNEYLKDTVKAPGVGDSFSYGTYNVEGTTDGGKDKSNIDVDEQGTLTGISNTQEAVRLHGDELSTNVQMMNTKLTQFTQNYNSFLSIASQLAKSTGDYFKSIASNVR